MSKEKKKEKEKLKPRQDSLTDDLNKKGKSRRDYD